MQTRIFVDDKSIDIEYTLADDCRFGVCLNIGEAKDVQRKLEQAITRLENGTLPYKEEVW